jgi:hypothetical protein
MCSTRKHIHLKRRLRYRSPAQGNRHLQLAVGRHIPVRSATGIFVAGSVFPVCRSHAGAGYPGGPVRARLFFHANHAVTLNGIRGG